MNDGLLGAICMFLGATGLIALQYRSGYSWTDLAPLIIISGLGTLVLTILWDTITGRRPRL